MVSLYHAEAVNTAPVIAIFCAGAEKKKKKKQIL